MMELIKGFTKNVLNDLQSSLDTVLGGLTQEEISWKPKETLNSIGLILFHTFRTEDFFIQELVRQQTQVWEKEKWFEKFGFTAEERGRHYQEEQVKTFVCPELSLLVDYNISVRRETDSYISGLTEDEYHRIVTTPRGERPVSGFLNSIITHRAQHTGEISYLRGLQRGLNK
ncbi:MAG: DinB family protein [Dehalococcoidales bacterium]|nr:MAG: DinB family protein [Dehalococcoidales bacterium]